MSGRLAGRVALVTGASRGIGRAVVKHLVAEGARVGALARSADALASLAGECPAGAVLPLAADVTDAAAVGDAFGTLVGHFGGLDVLVNNAGVGRFAPVAELDPADWDAMMAVNLRGAFLCAREAARLMMERRSGHIINVSSVAGLTTFPGGAGYCASKWGLMALTETLVQELKPYGVKVSVVCPGSVRTGFSASPPPYAMAPEEVAAVIADVAAAPAGVVINQVVMRPLVPPELRG